MTSGLCAAGAFLGFGLALVTQFARGWFSRAETVIGRWPIAAVSAPVPRVGIGPLSVLPIGTYSKLAHGIGLVAAEWATLNDSEVVSP